VFIVPISIVTDMIAARSNGLAKEATLYLHNENFTEKALEYLDEAIALSPRSADLFNLRGIAHSKLGNADSADADFRKVTELMPRAAEAHMNRGVDFIRQGNFDRAIEALTYATTVNPRLATAFSNLGTAYQKKGDLDSAIASYSRAIDLRAKYQSRSRIAPIRTISKASTISPLPMPLTPSSSTRACRWHTPISDTRLPARATR
jgi:Flp pilus assembly protein TadD